jgi:hypothetical protein
MAEDIGIGIDENNAVMKEQSIHDEDSIQQCLKNAYDIFTVHHRLSSFFFLGRSGGSKFLIFKPIFIYPLFNHINSCQKNNWTGWI